ncbi:MAG: cell division protein FtsZ [Ignavibacteriaceae bacterium]|jgi:cell division protein FtsZ|nr:MAG: cell division protein FtsZ [Chlorobiota bacterium]KXK03162.1 MAG: cell division protein FtsZ [Chlorobi bacterium OLB4]MBV6399621.1 Cell division protein FtsZ [Ignavibacteria bacterium]MCC6886338.1 cell division protein FtsZ [Ignavibacteriales bacterium]MCE7953777.1 cell division protein FtsZ [Chlorobi bacterium CHB7]MDL1887711.1 cell division protein FtsZ [Ignavibacteria bacterium CHB1]MEB2330290.1 cell division protein FtsZ [Ignavibacteriaceae bacterium]RIK48260.1 MAG: cell division
MPITLMANQNAGAKIKVIGVGGAGGNAINTMIAEGIEGVEFIAINTDIQALESNRANQKIQIGRNVTKGLGTGMDREKALKAVEESREEIMHALQDSDMVFITAGMGGGTGTGASAFVANVARSIDALVVGIVTKPFNFEGKPRQTLAEEGIKNLKEEVDSLIVIPNQKIIEEIDKKVTFEEAFKLADRVLYNATKGISQIITKTGHINVDFADVRTIMKGTGDALIGTGFATGEDRAIRAAEDALTNKLLETIDISGSESVLVNICSSGDVTIEEIEKANTYISNKAGENAKYIFGLVNDSELEEGIMITIIATGFKKHAARKEKKEEGLLSTKKGNGQIQIFSNNSGKIYTVPSDQELKNLDIPAIKRRQSDPENSLKIDEDFAELKSADDDKDIASDDSDFNYNELKLEEELKRPTFLRRMMD